MQQSESDDNSKSSAPKGQDPINSDIQLPDSYFDSLSSTPYNFSNLEVCFNGCIFGLPVPAILSTDIRC
ncbi:hypothetical protein K440DRAFT_626759 [Wilcoxina mikolae CBS 423.85]|nr:hypothetical protein K440DRAFT_626759 [Wilcoxina mikolae CBS 423.85]